MNNAKRYATPQKRNDLCKCNSGKKFKRCCGDNAEKARKHQEAWKPVFKQPTIEEPKTIATKTPLRRPHNLMMAALVLGTMSMGGRR